jgi:hypothetical protein
MCGWIDGAVMCGWIDGAVMCGWIDSDLGYNVAYHNTHTYMQFCWYRWKMLYKMAASCKSDKTDISSTA